MEPHYINIRQLSHRDQSHGAYFHDHLFITDCVEDVERFKSPCRVDAITVLVCLRGEVDCSINLKRYHVGSNMILVNFPENVIQIHRAEALEAYAILISTDFLNELEIDFRQRSDFYMNIRQNAVCMLPHAEIAKMKPYYSLLSDNIEKERTETSEIIRGLVRAFSYTVISLMRAYQKQEEENGNTSMDRNKQLFNKFMALAKLHHASNRGVKFYANKLFLTPNYLSGVIKEYSGKTVTEWVSDYVILESKIMLRNSEMSIQEIAFKLNFPTQSSFGKYFKKKVGVGPKQYRSGEEVII